MKAKLYQSSGDETDSTGWGSLKVAYRAQSVVARKFNR